MHDIDHSLQLLDRLAQSVCHVGVGRGNKAVSGVLQEPTQGLDIRLPSVTIPQCGIERGMQQLVHTLRDDPHQVALRPATPNLQKTNRRKGELPKSNQEANSNHLRTRAKV